MQIADTEIKSALSAVLRARGFSGVEPQLLQIEPPRAWGVATNVCFMLAGQAAAADVARETAGMSKGEAKKRASEITRAAGEKLAREIAAELASVGLTAVSASPVGRTAVSGIETEGQGPRAEGQGGGTGNREQGTGETETYDALATSRPVGQASGLPSNNSTGETPAPPADTAVSPTGRLPYIKEIVAEGAYINFYYDADALAAHVVDTVMQAEASAPGSFGRGAPVLLPDGRRKRIMVEYAQPNTHKDFHVGHLRNASIGQAIANLLEFAGNEVLKATYIGDVGLHVAKALWGRRYLQAAIENDNESILCYFTPIPSPESDPIGYWGSIYQGTNKLLSDLKSQSEAIPDAFPATSLESHDANYVQIFQSEKPIKTATDYTFAFNNIKRILSDLDAAISMSLEDEAIIGRAYPNYLDWKSTSVDCIDGFNLIFGELQIAFTQSCYFFESTVDKSGLGKSTATELQQLGIATIDEEGEYKGALYVDFAAQADAVRDGGHGGPLFQVEEADTAEESGQGRPLSPEPVFRDAEKKRIRQLGKMTILRSDGTSLYQTKELGLAKYKFDNFDIHESLYVVGAEQKLYFEQVFAILRLWGFPNAENCKHISYELVVLPSGKMSSREGNIVKYRELRDEAIGRARKLTEEKGIAGDVDSTAWDIAIAAIKYTMLAVTGAQQITFDFEQALAFDGRSAPYLQYAYARTRKLVEGIEAVGPTAVSAGGADVPARGFNPEADPAEGGTVGPTEENEADTVVSPTGEIAGTGGTPAPPELDRGLKPALPELDRGLKPALPQLHPSEVALARSIARFPSVVQEAAAKYEPATLCTYLYDIAGVFAEFYRDCHVLSAPAPQRVFRQRLTLAFRKIMAAGFKLLALPLPEEM